LRVIPNVEYSWLVVFEFVEPELLVLVGSVRQHLGEKGAGINRRQKTLTLEECFNFSQQYRGRRTIVQCVMASKLYKLLTSVSKDMKEVRRLERVHRRRQ
jgi:hypothetical protein